MRKSLAPPTQQGGQSLVQVRPKGRMEKAQGKAAESGKKRRVARAQPNAIPAAAKTARPQVGGSEGGYGSGGPRVVWARACSPRGPPPLPQGRERAF